MVGCKSPIEFLMHRVCSKDISVDVILLYKSFLYCPYLYQIITLNVTPSQPQIQL